MNNPINKNVKLVNVIERLYKNYVYLYISTVYHQWRLTLPQRIQNNNRRTEVHASQLIPPKIIIIMALT